MSYNDYFVGDDNDVDFDDDDEWMNDFSEESLKSKHPFLQY